jgi:hypothetical protein
LPKWIERDEPLHLLVDSTGVKIYGEGEWLDEKYGVRSRRRWRKLYLGVDANGHEIVAVELTYDAVAERHPGAVIIPPRSTAVQSAAAATQRDRHIATIGKRGRTGWRRSSGYSRRSLVEAAMYRYKAIVGRRLHARTPPNQRTEAKIGCNVLNRMTSLGMPVSVRIK